jgi:nitrogen regulatory protein P-II 1
MAASPPQEYERKLKVETVVADYKAMQVSEAIRKAARTGRVGDGVILILPVEEIVRIRTGERGNAAFANAPKLCGYRVSCV